MISLLFAGKYAALNKLLKVSAGGWGGGGGGVNAILKKVGLYLQTDSYLISNLSYTIKLDSKLKLRYSTFIRWNGLICILII